MLVFLSFCYITFNLFTSFSLFSPLLSLLLSLLIWTTSTNMFFNSSLILPLQPSLCHDEMSFFLFFLSLFVIYACCILSMQQRILTPLLLSNLLLILLVCYEVFHLDNLFLLYFFYEASLLPIVLIIVKWGSYPERSLRAVLMLIYTLVFGAPFVLVILSTFSSCSTLSLTLLNLTYLSPSLVVSVIVFLTFSVKLPLYGLHQWLPIAHVEAPTFGSVILAALLLKLGGVGMYRCLCLMNLCDLRYLALGYLIVATIWSFIACCFQSDIKRLIAYSSVAHMIAVPLLLLSSNLLSISSLTLLIILHGVSSSLLFILVGLVYTFFGTRQLISIRGLLLVSPLLSLIAVLSFFSTISAPPFPSFIAESFFMFSSYILRDYMILVYIPIVFLGLLYNLNWLSSLLLPSPISSSYSSSHLLYSSSMPMFLLLLMAFLLIFSISLL